MATGNSVHDEVKEQQQKLKGKPFKEKWAYFWEYYKIQTLVAIAALAFAGNLTLRRARIPSWKQPLSTAT